MIEKIKSVLAVEQPIKAREIARKLGVDTSQINSALYAHADEFVQNQKFEWSLRRPLVLVIEFPKARWLTVGRFETTLSSVESPLESDCPSVLFRLSPGTPVLLEAVARLLSLCNQLIEAKKNVTIDFQERGVSSYLNRLGFYDLLHKNVKILPKRPKVSTAGVYAGESTSIVEAKRIDLACRDENIPHRLSQCVRQHVKDATASVHTIVCELFSNIYEHSSSPIPGFAALQLYRGGEEPHVSTVFSDSGTGIIGSLLPTLPETTREELGKDGKDVGVALIEKIFTEGGLSRTNEQGHGTGLYRTGASAGRFRNGTVIVRQETFEVTIKFQNGEPIFSHRLALQKLAGTQICVKFALTRLDDAR
ncbi:hypothetical protein [Burkholderia seminalis]|uniref:hypothetical protein n=1 Tax=Burkholderia seminalis TaxID=488731 RepID=UPI001CF3A030|nr:hypothetical protein [Burkholderia seminalis]MCA8041830.1 hypothetical protein [Burkholderia seminalis]